MGELWTSDLAEAGLTRLQTRQLQNWAARAAGSAAGAADAAAAAGRRRPEEALPEALDPELEAEAASGQEEEAAIVWSAPAMATANAAPFESFFRLDLDSDSPSAKLPEALRRRLETRRETRRSTLSKRIKEEPSREEPAKAEPKKPEPSKRTFSSRLGRTRPGEEAPGAGAAMAMNTPRGAAAARGGGGLRCPIPKQSRSCQDSEPSERQMFDKVTLRLRHRQLFIASIEKHGTAETSLWQHLLNCR